MTRFVIYRKKPGEATFKRSINLLNNCPNLTDAKDRLRTLKQIDTDGFEYIIVEEKED